MLMQVAVFITLKYSSQWLYHNLFIHLTADGYLSCFYFWLQGIMLLRTFLCICLLVDISTFFPPRFIYLWLCWIFITVHRLSPAAMSRLPWWLSGKESACQCRGHRFNPWVRKIPLEKEKAAHSSILAWEIPRTKEPGQVTVHGVTKSGT